MTNPKLFISRSDTTAGIDRLDHKREKELAAMLLASAIETDKGKMVNLYEKDIYLPDTKHSCTMGKQLGLKV